MFSKIERRKHRARMDIIHKVCAANGDHIMAAFEHGINVKSSKERMIAEFERKNSALRLVMRLAENLGSELWDGIIQTSFVSESIIEKFSHSSLVR